MQKRLLALLMAIGLTAAACGSTADTVSETVDDATDQAAQVVDGEDDAMEDDAMEDASHDLNIVNSDLGQILVGSIERADGTIQATYNGWPLYLFASDEAPGDTNGQGANDVWWVLDAEGNAIAS